MSSTAYLKIEERLLRAPVVPLVQSDSGGRRDNRVDGLAFQPARGRLPALAVIWGAGVVLARARGLVAAVAVVDERRLAVERLL